MPQSRAQIFAQLNSRAEQITSDLKNHSNVSLHDLIILSAITITHATHIFPEWKDIAHKLVSDIIDDELLSISAE